MKINFKSVNMVKLTASEKEQYLNELIEFLKIPSISADSAFSDQVKQAAQWVADALTKAGADGVKIVPTKGYPIVYGEKIIDPNLPTVLVYGHYDVQPPDPLDLWDSPAFEPVIKKPIFIQREQFSPVVPAMIKGKCTCISKLLNG